MITIRVFDPAMCCSTGICGPAINPELVRFAADLDWLKGQGVSVERFNLSQQPAAFAEDAAVKLALEAGGEASLPLVEVDGNVKSSGLYPARDTLASWAGIAIPAPTREGPNAKSASCAPGKGGLLISRAGGCCAPAITTPRNASDAQKKSGCC